MLSLILYLLSFLAFVLSYTFYVAEEYAYQGFEYDWNILRIFAGVGAVALIAFLLPRRFEKASDFLLHVHFLNPILPTIVLYSVGGQAQTYTAYVSGVFLLLLFLLKFWSFSMPSVFAIGPKRLMICFICILIVYLIGILYVNGLTYVNFDLLKVYEFRELASRNIPAGLDYLGSNLTSTLLPCLLVFSIVTKSNVWTLVVFAASITIYVLTAHKAPLFYPVVAAGVYYFLNQRNPVNSMLKAFLALNCLCLMVFLLDGTFNVFADLVVRRTFFFPSLANFLYHDFFSNNELVLWASSKVTLSFLDYPYHTVPSKLIGEVYYFDGSNLNVGWLGTGYMHGGLLGLVFYAFVLSLLMRGIDAYSRDLGKEFVAATAVIPMIILYVSTDLPTSVLTHGIAVLFIVYASIRKYRLT